jgi:hypothetical protein
MVLMKFCFFIIKNAIVLTHVNTSFVFSLNRHGLNPIVEVKYRSLDPFLQLSFSFLIRVILFRHKY